MKRKLALSLTIAICLLILAAFYFRYQIYYSHGTEKQEIVFEIKSGEGNAQIAQELKDKGLISGKIYFYCYMRSNSLLNKIFPGKYNLSGSMTIAEIARTITTQKEAFVKITFPEGWASAKMAKRISENGFDGEEFLRLVSDPAAFKNKYAFLDDPKVKTLEGYLFPDTYFFSPKAAPEGIISKMLDNFSQKVDDKMLGDMKNQKKSLRDILAMASVIEMEVKSPADRAVVSGIFWNRIQSGVPLQSCATIAYILGVSKKQYSFEDTRIQSPYNTYLNPGLPPGPISNPGAEAIKAAAYPKATDYFYFLSDPETGETHFAKTIDEHNANKVKFGL